MEHILQFLYGRFYYDGAGLSFPYLFPGLVVAVGHFVISFCSVYTMIKRARGVLNQLRQVCKHVLRVEFEHIYSC